jgi:2-haloacid dehalogenase
MDQKRIEGVKAWVFDAYGTLFDYASAAARCRDELGEKFERLTSLWREKQLQYTWLRALQGKHADFWTVTGDALDFTLETLEMASPALRERLMTFYWNLDPFPEVPAVLRQLKHVRLKTAILSNGTPEMLRRAVESANIGPFIDAVLSVEEVGVYKPHPKVYQLAIDRLGIHAEATAFVSSNAWDAWAASAFGMRAVWCNRYGQVRERLPGAPQWVVKSLSELSGIDAQRGPRQVRG